LINYGGIGGNNELSKLITSIAKTDGLYYDEKDLKKKINHHITTDKPLVISNEFSIGMVLPLNQDIPQSREVIADRYKKLFPDARILLVIRNQFDIQKSVYVQTLTSHSKYFSHRKLPFKKWMEMNIYQFQNGWINSFEFSDYYSLVCFYKKKFKDVKVVLFEEIIKDMPGFVNKELCPYLGISGEEAIKYYEDAVLNRRHSRWEIVFEKLIRNSIHLLQNKLGYPQKIIAEKKRSAFMKRLHHAIDSISVGKIKANFSEAHKKFMLDFYGEGNQKLSEMLQIDLGKYGYPVKDTKTDN
jgi:hypothetical protein